MEITIRNFSEEDFPSIQILYKEEGWNTFISRPENALRAWKNSNIALVALHDKKVIGALRGITDQYITSYIAEIVVDKDLRGHSIGKALIEKCHELYPSTRMDLLSSKDAHKFYKSNGFKCSTGFRKSFPKI